MTTTTLAAARPPPLSSSHVRLQLTSTDKEHQEPLSAVLDIPLRVIERNSLNHLKYLEFCASYITGLFAGKLVLEGTDDGLSEPDGVVKGGQEWRWFVYDKQDVLGHSAFNLEALSDKSSARSSRESLENRILSRENVCVFTGLDEACCQVMHVMPHPGAYAGSPRIDHPRNIIFVTGAIRNFYDNARIAISATPKHLLSTTDVPLGARHSCCPPSSLELPCGVRYTLQWLQDPLPGQEPYVSEHNVDARFTSRPSSQGSAGAAPRVLPNRNLVNHAYVCRMMTNFGKTLIRYRPRLKKVGRPAPSQRAGSKRWADSCTSAEHEDGRRNNNWNRKPALGEGNDEAKLILEAHPGGYGKYGEDGRISAEDFMRLLHRRARGKGYGIWEEGGEAASGELEDEVEASARLEGWLQTFV